MSGCFSKVGSISRCAPKSYGLGCRLLVTLDRGDDCSFVEVRFSRDDFVSETDTGRS